MRRANRQVYHKPPPMSVASLACQFVKRLQRQTILLDDKIIRVVMEIHIMLKVLAIDDDPAMTELLALLLKTHSIDVYIANTGEDGIKLMRAVSPDVIILDLMMPGLDGWQVCKQVRSFSNVPILILSALDSPGMVASALDAGADDYLVKPVPIGELVAHLKTLTRRPIAQKSDRTVLKVKTAPLSI
jgi:DNA-binding response OmpR family regulator